MFILIILFLGENEALKNELQDLKRRIQEKQDAAALFGILTQNQISGVKLANVSDSVNYSDDFQDARDQFSSSFLVQNDEVFVEQETNDCNETSEKQASKEQISEKQSSEQQTLEKQAPEEQTSEKLAFEKQASEEQASEEQTSEKLAFENQASESREINYQEKIIMMMESKMNEMVETKVKQALNDKKKANIQMEMDFMKEIKILTEKIEQQNKKFERKEKEKGKEIETLKERIDYLMIELRQMKQEQMKWQNEQLKKNKKEPNHKLRKNQLEEESDEDLSVIDQVNNSKKIKLYKSHHQSDDEEDEPKQARKRKVRFSNEGILDVKSIKTSMNLNSSFDDDDDENIELSKPKRKSNAKTKVTAKARASNAKASNYYLEYLNGKR